MSSRGPNLDATFVDGEILANATLSNATRFRFENELLWAMADTDRRAITLANATWAYLEELSKPGTHGRTAPGVAATLVEIGVREAIEKGYLKLKRAMPLRVKGASLEWTGF